MPNNAYDQSCEDLARDFLGDYPEFGGNESAVETLAAHIQEAIEDWIAFHADQAAETVVRIEKGGAP